MNDIYTHWTSSNSEQDDHVLWELMDACKLLAGFIPDDKNLLKLIPSNLSMMTAMRDILSEYNRDKPFDVIRVKSIFHAKYKKNYINYVNALKFIEWATLRNYKLPPGILTAMLSANIEFKGNCTEILYNHRVIDWAYWMGMKTLSARQASLLMFSLDPELYNNPELKIDTKIGTTVLVRKSNKFEQLALNHGVSDISPGEWVIWAKKHSFQIPLTFEAYFTSSQQALPKNKDVSAEDESEIENLFNPVSVNELEKIFPDNGKWSDYTKRGSRNGLINARIKRAKYNPYKAALWWLDKQKPVNWDLAKCMRKLAAILPPRSIDKKHLLTGDYD